MSPSEQGIILGSFRLAGLSVLLVEAPGGQFSDPFDNGISGQASPYYYLSVYEHAGIRQAVVRHPAAVAQ